MRNESNTMYHGETESIGVEVSAKGDRYARIDHGTGGWRGKSEDVGGRGQQHAHGARSRHGLYAFLRHLLQVTHCLSPKRSPHLAKGGGLVGRVHKMGSLVRVWEKQIN